MDGNWSKEKRSPTVNNNIVEVHAISLSSGLSCQIWNWTIQRSECAYMRWVVVVIHFFHTNKSLFSFSIIV